MGHLPEHARGLLIAFAGVLVLTPDSLLVRLASVDNATILFWRGLLMAVALAGGLAAVKGRRTAGSFRAVGRGGLLAAGLFVCSSAAFIYAINTTTVANTLVIASAAPLFAALLTRAVLGEPVAARTWLAIAGAIAGTVVIVSGSLGSGALLGDLAALAAALSIAGMFTLLRHYRHVNMIPAISVSSLLVAVVVWPWAAPLSISGADVVWLGVMGLVVLPVSIGLLTLAPRYLPAPEVTLIMLLETVLGPFWVWLALGEEPSVYAVLGGAIVIGALAGHATAALRRRRPAGPAG